jgi:hypothetical protein
VNRGAPAWNWGTAADGFLRVVRGKHKTPEENVTEFERNHDRLPERVGWVHAGLPRRRMLPAASAVRPMPSAGRIAVPRANTRLENGISRAIATISLKVHGGELRTYQGGAWLGRDFKSRGFRAIVAYRQRVSRWS